MDARKRKPTRFALSLLSCFLAVSSCVGQKPIAESSGEDSLSLSQEASSSSQGSPCQISSGDDPYAYHGEYGIRQLHGDEENFYIYPYYGPDAWMDYILELVLECTREEKGFRIKLGYGIPSGESMKMTIVGGSVAVFKITKEFSEIENDSLVSTELKKYDSTLKSTEGPLEDFWKPENYVKVGKSLTGEGVYPYYKICQRKKKFPCFYEDFIPYEELQPSLGTKTWFDFGYGIDFRPKEGKFYEGTPEGNHDEFTGMSAHIFLCGVSSHGQIYLFQDGKAAMKLYDSIPPWKLIVD